MNRWSALAALLLAFAAALALRLPHLSARPLHNDEAVNAIKVTELWEKGVYRYDPDEYHGPTLHYATVPFLWLSGAKSSIHLRDSALRLGTVFFGAAFLSGASLASGAASAFDVSRFALGAAAAPPRLAFLLTAGVKDSFFPFSPG